MPFYILSIDGGGIRGAFSAHILNCVQTRLGIRLLDQFNMVAGTSTGSILAAAVVGGIDLNKVERLYKDHGTSIFARKKPWIPKRIGFLTHSTYKNDPLHSLLKEVLGDVRLGEITTPLLIPATDVGNGGVHILKSSYSAGFTRDPKVFLRDAVMASCSAPLYFDPTKVNEYLLADGGLWANNPALAAVIDAKYRLGIRLEEIRLLSIGTGTSKTYYGANTDRKWGILNGWKRLRFIDFCMSLQTQATHNYISLLLDKSQLFRINFESDNPLPLDDCTKIADLISRADKEFTHNSPSLQSFLKGN